MNHQNKIFFFDFDGVICDSTYECMVTSFNSWSFLNNTNKFRCKVKEFSSNEIKYFKSRRPYAKGAGDYYILNKFFTDKIKDKFNEETLIKYRKKWKFKIEIFKKKFYEQRKKLINKNISNWIDLHIFNNDVLNFIKKLNHKKKLNIITLKDYKSVDILCRSKHLFLKRKQVFDESIISNKADALNKFSKFNAIKKENIIFIDDNIFHLIDPKLKNFSIYLKNWADIPKEYLLIAKNNNIPIIYDIEKFFINRTIFK